MDPYERFMQIFTGAGLGSEASANLAYALTLHYPDHAAAILAQIPEESP